MCLPDRRTKSSTVLSLLPGAAMLLACVAAPTIVGLADSAAIGAVLGPLAAIVAVAACAGLPLLVRRRHRARDCMRPSSDDATVASSSITTP
jgi:Flp pilus assembly protein TadB